MVWRGGKQRCINKGALTNSKTPTATAAWWESRRRKKVLGRCIFKTQPTLMSTRKPCKAVSIRYTTARGGPLAADSVKCHLMIWRALTSALGRDQLNQLKIFVSQRGSAWWRFNWERVSGGERRSNAGALGPRWPRPLLLLYWDIICHSQHHMLIVSFSSLSSHLEFRVIHYYSTFLMWRDSCVCFLMNGCDLWCKKLLPFDELLVFAKKWYGSVGYFIAHKIWHTTL